MYSYAVSSCRTFTTPCDAFGPAFRRRPFNSTRSGTKTSATLRSSTARGRHGPPTTTTSRSSSSEPARPQAAATRCNRSPQPVAACIQPVRHSATIAPCIQLHVRCVAETVSAAVAATVAESFHYEFTVLLRAVK